MTARSRTKRSRRRRRILSPIFTVSRVFRRETSISSLRFLRANRSRRPSSETRPPRRAPRDILNQFRTLGRRLILALRRRFRRRFRRGAPFRPRGSRLIRLRRRDMEMSRFLEAFSPDSRQRIRRLQTSLSRRRHFSPAWVREFRVRSTPERPGSLIIPLPAPFQDSRIQLRALRGIRSHSSRRFRHFRRMLSNRRHTIRLIPGLKSRRSMGRLRRRRLIRALLSRRRASRQASFRRMGIRRILRIRPIRRTQARIWNRPLRGKRSEIAV